MAAMNLLNSPSSYHWWMNCKMSIALEAGCVDKATKEKLIHVIYGVCPFWMKCCFLYFLLWEAQEVLDWRELPFFVWNFRRA